MLLIRIKFARLVMNYLLAVLSATTVDVCNVKLMIIGITQPNWVDGYLQVVQIVPLQTMTQTHFTDPAMFLIAMLEEFMKVSALHVLTNIQ